MHSCTSIMPSPLDEPEQPTPSKTPQPDGVSSARDSTQPLAIEAGQAGATEFRKDEGEVEEVHTLDLGEGNVVKLDKLGPMIINSDGVCYHPSWLSTSRPTLTRAVDAISNSKLARPSSNRARKDCTSLSQEAKFGTITEVR